MYDTRKVFPSYVEVNGGNLSGLNDGDEYVTGPGIIDENYNRYEKLTGANAGTYNKGEYWINYYDENDSTNFRLERYASIPVSGATIYIDGQIVIDENNTPVLSDEAGNFEISVPIGNHFIRVEKMVTPFLTMVDFLLKPVLLKNFLKMLRSRWYLLMRPE